MAKGASYKERLISRPGTHPAYQPPAIRSYYVRRKKQLSGQFNKLHPYGTRIAAMHRLNHFIKSDGIHWRDGRKIAMRISTLGMVSGSLGYRKMKKKLVRG